MTPFKQLSFSSFTTYYELRFMIAELIINKGAAQVSFIKDAIVFYEGNPALYYYEIIQGSVKMFNQNISGREFTQASFKAGECFGEAPLLINKNYACSAIATENTELLKFPKEGFLELLNQEPAIQSKFLNLLAERNYEKSVTAREVINQDAEKRILSFMERYKRENTNEDSKVMIPFTRQEIANYTGLRVETVIRTLSGMKERQLVAIVKRKLFF